MVIAPYKNITSPRRLWAIGPQLPKALKLHRKQRDTANHHQVTQAGVARASGAQRGTSKSGQVLAGLPEPVRVPGRHLWGPSSQNPQRYHCLRAKKLSSEPPPPRPHRDTSTHDLQIYNRKPKHVPFPLLESSTPRLTSMTPGIHVRVVNS